MSLRRSLGVEQTPDQRAAALLREVLTPEERAVLDMTQRLIITGSEGGRYEIGLRSCSGNIKPLQPVTLGVGSNWFHQRRTANEFNMLCAHPPRHVYDDDGVWRGQLPLMDAIVTQVLTIKANERHFLRTALIYC
jgi:hypothetical protein